MNENSPIEVLPKIKTFKCKLLVYLIYLSLSFLPIVLAIVGGFYYNDFFIGIAIYLSLLFASGIVGSKLSDEAIPLNQRELKYTNLDIAKWYVIRVLICE